jgi:D-aminopeptidase
VPFDGTPGKLNAITDVSGVEVGATTLIRGDGRLKVGEGPVRTGVTVIFPRGKQNTDNVYAGYFSLNGNGEMTGTTWLEEAGLLKGPVAITNTHSVGVVRDSIIAWAVKQRLVKDDEWSLPVVAETWDGWLNDLNGFHVKQEDVFAALDSADTGAGCRREYGWRYGNDLLWIQGAVRERLRGSFRRKMVAIPWACWCSATAEGGHNLRLRGCRLGRK